MFRNADLVDVALAFAFTCFGLCLVIGVVVLSLVTLGVVNV